MNPLLRFSLLVVFAAVVPACVEHRVKSDPIEVKPIEVKPIHITVDVNVRVDRELDQFFEFEEEIPPQPKPAE